MTHISHGVSINWTANQSERQGQPCRGRSLASIHILVIMGQMGRAYDTGRLEVLHQEESSMLFHPGLAGVGCRPGMCKSLHDEILVATKLTYLLIVLCEVAIVFSCATEDAHFQPPAGLASNHVTEARCSDCVRRKSSTIVEKGRQNMPTSLMGQSCGKEKLEGLESLCVPLGGQHIVHSLVSN